MFTRGIRGAISVDENTENAIESATIELLSAIIKENSVKTENISHVIFSLTNDLDAAFPAKFARTKFDFDMVPMECLAELDVEGAMRMCLRILMVVNTEAKQNDIRHIYLKGAQKLRPDLSQ